MTFDDYAGTKRSAWGFDSTDPDHWKADAVCVQTDPEAFFPEKGGSTREAKRICVSCPVRAECLQWALTHDERFGIWGGLSERERRRLKRGEDVTPTTGHGARHRDDRTGKIIDQ